THIDDIVPLPQSRRKGYASRLLEEVRKIGAETGVTKIHLNVHVNHDRADAHRLYFKNGFEICAYHFRCDPK
ncbi:GNAT family N-acetyltransferase, partial [Neisseria meningitidis]|uniref:GNAT family N-acetyltransferase n=1 Tax=Neisseria meningitidis TaxID=487 RepID=UPI001F0BAAAC